MRTGLRALFSNGNQQKSHGVQLLLASPFNFGSVLAIHRLADANPRNHRGPKADMKNGTTCSIELRLLYSVFLPAFSRHLRLPPASSWW